MFVREAKFGKKGKDGELECEENEKGDAKKSFSGNGRNRLPVSHNASKDEGREKSKIDWFSRKRQNALQLGGPLNGIEKPNCITSLWAYYSDLTNKVLNA